MLKFFSPCIVLIVLVLLPSSFAVADENNDQSYASIKIQDKQFSEADRLVDQGGIENIQKALEIYQKEADQTPGSYEANWKCAKAHYLYADACIQQGVAGWEEICKNFGKAGFGYGEKAISIAPDKIEGNLYYGLCVWKYSDGVSILRALKEGLKGSTQNAFEKSYAIDKMFDNGWPMKALGRFWQQLPWPLKDDESSQKYLAEHHQHFPDDPQGLVFLSETLIDLGDKQKAKQLLEIAAKNKTDPYYSAQATEILADKF
jgi:uncharacterized protein YxeA